MDAIITVPFGYLLDFLYRFTSNYGVALILFAIAVRVVLLPINLFSGSLSNLQFEPLSTVMLLVICFVHTGIAYLCYFGSLEHIPANTAAILTYVDPVTAVLMSTLILHEPISALNVVGVVLILGATLVSEMTGKKK